MNVHEIAERMRQAGTPYVGPIWAEDIANNLAGAKDLLERSHVKKSICRRVASFGMPCVDIEKCADDMFAAMMAE